MGEKVTLVMTRQEEKECVDDDYRDGVQIGDSYGDFCYEYLEHPNWCGQYDTEDFDSGVMCCACDGGIAEEADEGDEQDEGNEVDEGEGDDDEADEGDEGEGDEGEADEGDDGEGEADEGDEGEGDEGEADEGDEGEDLISCPCDCDPMEYTCWEQCHACLDAIFGMES